MAISPPSLVAQEKDQKEAFSSFSEPNKRNGLVKDQAFPNQIQRANYGLKREDQELIDYAKSCLEEVFVAEKHFVVSAFRTKSGKIYTGFNLKTTAARASVCAESIALAKCVEALDKDIDTFVVIARLNEETPVIVSPCGVCRELLYDYAPYAQIIIASERGPQVIPIKELLVFPYKR